MAAQEAAQPFEYCDVVTTTTHKSLRGPRAGMIFFRVVRPHLCRSDTASRLQQLGQLCDSSVLVLQLCRCLLASLAAAMSSL